MGLLAALPAQQPASPVDPYTKGDAVVMERASYVSFGPFAWDDEQDTAGLRRLLPTVPLLFVETAHFKLGSSLPAIRLPRKQKHRRQIRRELGALAKFIPAVDPKVRVLDRWLRLHMFARRLEEHYAEFSRHLAVTDADFPKTPVRLGHGPLKGEGPYLGMRGKFLVLLLEKVSNLGRYTNRVSREPQPIDRAHTHHFLGRGSMFVGIATEINDGRLAGDHAMRCNLLYCVTLSLVNGYKGYRYSLPEWLPQGIAHWYSHRLDPLEHSYRPLRGGMPAEQLDPKWARNVRGLVKHASFRPLDELMGVQHAAGLDFLDIMASWSRTDYMLKANPEAFAAFMAAAKDPIDPDSGKIPTFAQVRPRLQAALEAAWGHSPAEFDAAWAKFVLKNYPKK